MIFPTFAAPFKYGCVRTAGKGKKTFLENALFYAPMHIFLISILINAILIQTLDCFDRIRKMNIIKIHLEIHKMGLEKINLNGYTVFP